MRVLITGGFGFVGGRLADYLSKSGHEIILGTRRLADSPVWLSQADVLEIDWSDGAALTKTCKGVDVIIHAAGMNAQDCAANPVAALAVNGLETAQLVAIACQSAVRRFIYISTAHVYAKPLVGNITEEVCPRNSHPYATSHLAGENSVLGESRQGKIEGIVLRLSNAYGAPMHQGVNCWMLLANDLCRQAVEIRELVLQSNGLDVRDFIGLNEVCRAVEPLVSGCVKDNQTGIFNLGSGKSLSAIEMAKIIQQRSIEILGFKPEIRCQDGGGGNYSSYDKLSYKSERFAALGIDFKSQSHAEEIDKLLQYCQKTFTQIVGHV